jgi:hypothetical protein
MHGPPAVDPRQVAPALRRPFPLALGRSGKLYLPFRLLAD